MLSWSTSIFFWLTMVYIKHGVSSQLIYFFFLLVLRGILLNMQFPVNLAQAKIEDSVFWRDELLLLWTFILLFRSMKWHGMNKLTWKNHTILCFHWGHLTFDISDLYLLTYRTVANQDFCVHYVERQIFLEHYSEAIYLMDVFHTE